MRGRRIKLGAGLAAALVFALGAAYALADDVISTSPTALSYSANSFTITAGSVAQFHNASVGGIYGSTAHSVNGEGKLGGKPLFASKIISGGQTAAVNGTQYLAPGDYRFFCAVHGPSMSATLHVTGGTPVARPRLTLAIDSTKVAKVRKSGKLQVTVSDEGTDASGVSLVAKLGRKTLASKRGLKVGAGSSEPVALELSNAGEKALKGKDRATVTLGGTVAYGPPASAMTTLK